VELVSKVTATFNLERICFGATAVHKHTVLQIILVFPVVADETIFHLVILKDQPMCRINVTVDNFVQMRWMLVNLNSPLGVLANLTEMINVKHLLILKTLPILLVAV